MSAIKKVMVLSNKQSSSGPMAVLTMYKSNAGVFANFKNHNLHIKDAILAISINGKQVLKQPISLKDKNNHTFKLDNNVTLNGKIGCVLVENKNDKITPMVWGLSAGNDSHKQVVINSLQALVDKMIEINEQNKKPEIIMKKIEEHGALKSENKHHTKGEQKESSSDYKDLQADNNNQQENSENKKKLASSADGKAEHEHLKGKEKSSDNNEHLQEHEHLKNAEATRDNGNQQERDYFKPKQAVDKHKENHNHKPALDSAKNTQKHQGNSQDVPDKKQYIYTERRGIHDITGFVNMHIDNGSAVASSLDNSSSMQELEERIIKPDIPSEEANLYEYTDEEVEEQIDEELGFYCLIKEQVDELFAKYPPEKELEKLLPGSKWVKVDYENDGHYYVIGLIYENQELKYICYGVPGTHDKEPPSDFAKYSQWLPLVPSLPEGEGYWLMYQDANDGHSVNLEVI